MRPVDKGADQGEFRPYENAQQPLKTQLGSFCSYCERWIPSGIHVEHKKPKNDYPDDKFKWTNFLLSCPNCNSGKGHGELDLANYVWPDSDNTFRAFSYDSEGRVAVASALSGDARDLAESTWKMVNLNKHPDVDSGYEEPTPKDDRWQHRRQAWERASSEKAKLDILAAHPRISYFKEQAAEIATERGMFSVWMAVFESDDEMKKLLIQKFQGTATDCFDGDSNPVERPNGQI
jgi:uncharacterized protein (TIGR02646 family)